MCWLIKNISILCLWEVHLCFEYGNHILCLEMPYKLDMASCKKTLSSYKGKHVNSELYWFGGANLPLQLPYVPIQCVQQLNKHLKD